MNFNIFSSNIPFCNILLILQNIWKSFLFLHTSLNDSNNILNQTVSVFPFPCPLQVSTMGKGNHCQSTTWKSLDLMSGYVSKFESKSCWYIFESTFNLKKSTIERWLLFAHLAAHKGSSGFWFWVVIQQLDFAVWKCQICLISVINLQD